MSSPTPNASLPRQGRLAAIDYGTVRLGVAITDPDQRLASPLENYTRRGTDGDAKWLANLVTTERIMVFVCVYPACRFTRADRSQKSTERVNLVNGLAK